MGFMRVCFVLILCSLNKMCASTDVKIGVLLPESSKYPWNLRQILPAVELAIERVKQEILPNTQLWTLVADTNCSEIKGPLEAIKMHEQGANVFLGPVCDYAAAPVARYSPFWNIPLITAGASAGAFADKSEFALLTRIHATSSSTAESVIQFTEAFKWTEIELLYEDEMTSLSVGRRECFMTMHTLYLKFKALTGISTSYQKIKEDFDLTNILQTASSKAKVFVLCGSPDTVRELMITTSDLGMDSGEFVFLNINLEIIGKEVDKPWYKRADTQDRNNKARKAYEVLMTITAREPSQLEYTKFSNEVKKRGMRRYPDMRYKPGNVNGYVGAFHDAVILYALALNETMEAGDLITNGAAVTSRMWSKTFRGVTGDVSIDKNGDRLVDYSLLDMNPQTGHFEVVANYIASSKNVEQVPGKEIHFGADNESHKKDCDSDDIDCSDKEDKADKQQNVKTMLEDLKMSLAKISTAVDEHRTKLDALTNLINEDESD